MPTLAFGGQLALQYMENTIGTNPGDISSPLGAYIRPQIVECKL